LAGKIKSGVRKSVVPENRFHAITIFKVPSHAAATVADLS